MRLRQRITIGAAVTLIAFGGVACSDDEASTPSVPSVPTVPATTEPAGPTTTVPGTTVAPPTTPAPTAPTTPIPTTAPATTAPTTPAPTTAPGSQVDVRVYLVRDERLVIAHRDVTGPAVLRGALEALVDGATGTEAADGSATAIPDGTTIRSVDLDDGLATVDLSSAFDDGGGSASMQTRVAQVVFTATQFPNVDRVRFWMDGAPIDTLGGEGLILTEPQARVDVPLDISGSVIIDLPQPGDTVTSPIRVLGEATAFEAQFPIEIRRDGEQIGGMAPVTGGSMGDWATFDVTIEIDAAPGPIELVAYDAGGCGDDPECPPLILTIVPLVLAA